MRYSLSFKYLVFLMICLFNFSHAEFSNNENYLSIRSKYNGYQDKICDLNLLNAVIQFERENKDSFIETYFPGTIFVTGELTNFHHIDIEQIIDETLQKFDYYKLNHSDEDSIVTIIHKQPQEARKNKIYSSNHKDLVESVLRSHKLTKKIIKSINPSNRSKHEPHLILRCFEDNPNDVTAIVINTKETGKKVDTSNFYFNSVNRFIAGGPLRYGPRILINTHESPNQEKQDYLR